MPRVVSTEMGQPGCHTRRSAQPVGNARGAEHRDRQRRDTVVSGATSAARWRPSLTRGRRAVARPRVTLTSALFGGRGIDDALDLGDVVGGEAALLRVLAHHLLVRRHVHAVDLVAGHVALDPLDLRPEALQHAARLLRDRLQLLRAELAGAGDLTLDEVLGHGGLLVERPWAPCRAIIHRAAIPAAA